MALMLNYQKTSKTIKKLIPKKYSRKNIEILYFQCSEKRDTRNGEEEEIVLKMSGKKKFGEG